MPEKEEDSRKVETGKNSEEQIGFQVQISPETDERDVRILENDLCTRIRGTNGERLVDNEWK